MPEEKVSKLFRNGEELLEAETGQIEGKGLPPYVNGMILRNGPAKYDLSENFSMNHFYDGYALLQKFEISNGKTVKFTKKYLGSEAYKRASAAGKPCMLEFCTKAYADPEKNVLVRHLPNVSS
jgi:carotenoid cleavage dioxygenase-like enzyme